MWPFIEKQRRLLKNEQGAIIKDWGGKISVCLVYPNTYHIGMSNLAVHSIYKLFNEQRGLVCERAFLPSPSELKEHRRTKTPIISIETQRPISDFDCVAFSISFQNDLLNIIPILKTSSIPHRAAVRNDSHPLLIAGGCAVTMNPLPLSKIFDAFVIGEAEEIVPEIASILNEHLSRPQRLDALSEIIFVPPKPLCKTPSIVKELDPWPTQTVIYTPHTEFGGMHLIEMSRGCPRRCKFCATPCLYDPYRSRGLPAISNMIKKGLLHRKRFGLIGSDLLFHKAFFDTVNFIHEMGAVFSPSSLRVDEVDENVASLLAKSGHKSVSIGIEAATERLRSYIGKRFSNERVFETASALAAHKIGKLRLYFMIGLPTETEDDIKAIAELAKEIKKRFRLSIQLTINPFVPKPLTPFASFDFAGEKILKERLKLLKRLIGKSAIIHAESIPSAVCDALLSKGDSSLISFLEKS